jgi:hypothetical protein
MEWRCFAVVGSETRQLSAGEAVRTIKTLKRPGIDRVFAGQGARQVSMGLHFRDKSLAIG